MGTFYGKKLQKENLLTQKLEELTNDFNNINIMNMNEDEEKSYNELKSKFENSINEKNLDKSEELYKDLLKLNASVSARLEKEKRMAKEEEEKIKAEEEKKAEEENLAAEKAKEEADKIQNSAAGNNEQKAKTNENISARIGNTSPAANSSQLIFVVSTGGTYAEVVLWQEDSEGIWYDFDRMSGRLGENGRWKSEEHLTDYQNAYKYVLVIDYNRWPGVSGKSSAIFMHVDVGIPTWGCVAVPESKLVKILNWLNPAANPKIMLAMNYEELYIY